MLSISSIVVTATSARGDAASNQLLTHVNTFGMVSIRIFHNSLLCREDATIECSFERSRNMPVALLCELLLLPSTGALLSPRTHGSSTIPQRFRRSVRHDGHVRTAAV